MQLLHLASLAPALASVCCAIVDRSERSSSGWLPGMLMFVAMVDVASGAALVAPIAWSAGMLVAAVWLAARTRFASLGERARQMGLHRSLGLVVMSGLLLAGHHIDTDAHRQHGLIGVLAVVGTIGYLAFSGWLAASLVSPGNDARRAGYLGAGEVSGMAVSAALMAIALA